VTYGYAGKPLRPDKSVVAVGYSKSNTSPILKLFLSRLDELVGPNQKH
jgi:hypothetical protein